MVISFIVFIPQWFVGKYGSITKCLGPNIKPISLEFVMEINSNEELDRLINMVSAMIGVDIGVINKELVAIGGTGNYRRNIGTLRPRRSYGQQCILTGETFILKEPTNGKYCKLCDARHTCPLVMAIYYPIKTEPTIEGTVILLAYNKQHCTTMTTNLSQYQNYLSTIAALIAKIIVKDMKNKSALKTLQCFETVINDLEKPTIIVTAEGKISHINPAAEYSLSANAQELTGCNLADIVKKIGLREISASGLLGHPLGFPISKQGKKGKDNRIPFLSKPVLFEGRPAGLIIHIESNSPIRVYPLTSQIRHDDPFEEIIGSSQTIKTAVGIARKFAVLNSTILLRGESGTGKELMARGIHFSSTRFDKRLVVINCSTVPENLLESELFGYEEGAFTGAKREGKMGKFELANGGTMFLDEVGDLPMATQSKLLRILEDGFVEKIGGTFPVKVDVRIIAATNRDLEDMVSTGKFRQDLYYRLNVVPIKMPPLRERMEDVPELFRNFMDQYSKKLGLPPKTLSPKVEKLFLNYSWPGNVRELRNLVEYLIQTSDELIKIGDLTQALQNFYIDTLNAETPQGTSLNEMSRLERDAIKGALETYGLSVDGKRKAAEFLGVSLATLYRRLAIYNTKFSFSKYYKSNTNIHKNIYLPIGV